MIHMPENIQLSLDGNTVRLKGPKGEESRSFSMLGLKISRTSEGLQVEAGKILANTVEAHIRNMIRGVTDGYLVKMKIIYSHFPISVEVKAGDVVIKNFIGEKKPRRARIIGKTKVEVKGQEITISGTSRDDVGQTVANIKNATRIRKRDSRVFQDGVYKVEE